MTGRKLHTAYLAGGCFEDAALEVLEESGQCGNVGGITLRYRVVADEGVWVQVTVDLRDVGSAARMVRDLELRGLLCETSGRRALRAAREIDSSKVAAFAERVGRAERLVELLDADPEPVAFWAARTSRLVRGFEGLASSHQAVQRLREMSAPGSMRAAVLEVLEGATVACEALEDASSATELAVRACAAHWLVVVRRAAKAFPREDAEDWQTALETFERRELGGTLLERHAAELETTGAREPPR